MAVMVFFMFLIGVTTFFVRKNAVVAKKVSVKYFRIYDMRDGEPPEFVVRMARHYDNMMQVPLLFLITGVVCLIYGLHGWIPVTFGWIFVVSRVLHTYVHLGSNNVLKRAGFFAIGWLCILVLWVIIVTHGMQIPLVRV